MGTHCGDTVLKPHLQREHNSASLQAPCPEITQGWPWGWAPSCPQNVPPRAPSTSQDSLQTLPSPRPAASLDHQRLDTLGWWLPAEQGHHRSPDAINCLGQEMVNEICHQGPRDIPACRRVQQPRAGEAARADGVLGRGQSPCPLPLLPTARRPKHSHPVLPHTGWWRSRSQLDRASVLLLCPVHRQRR
jgi:hypothetical protein